MEVQVASVDANGIMGIPEPIALRSEISAVQSQTTAFSTQLASLTSTFDSMVANAVTQMLNTPGNQLYTQISNAVTQQALPALVQTTVTNMVVPGSNNALAQALASLVNRSAFPGMVEETVTGMLVKGAPSNALATTIGELVNASEFDELSLQSVDGMLQTSSTSLLRNVTSNTVKNSALPNLVEQIVSSMLASGNTGNPLADKLSTFVSTSSLDGLVQVRESVTKTAEDDTLSEEGWILFFF